MFSDLVDYVRTYMNLVDYEVYGRYVVETYDDGYGRPVVIDVWDCVPVLVKRPGLVPVYRSVNVVYGG